jgi:hypothetical protein
MGNKQGDNIAFLSHHRKMAYPRSTSSETASWDLLGLRMLPEKSL